ncbi:MAG: DUF72 domain-containing protein [bacterium]|nr:DUF72 domain-containing protein [bacterium]
MKKIFFGTAGWSYPDWKGTVYPAGIYDSFDRLRYLSNFIDFIEINSSFYAYPPPENANNWANSVRDNRAFTFSVKLHRDFTHTPTFISEKMISAVKNPLEILQNKGRFSCLLIQFPYSFHYTKENRLKAGKILKTFRDYNPVIEIRHNSWDCAGAESFLYENSSGIVTVDQPEKSLNIGPKFHDKGRIFYLRLHGRNKEHWFGKESGRDKRYNYLYSEEELRPFAAGLSDLPASGVSGYAAGNNHYAGQALANILQLKSMVLKSKTKCPGAILENYGALNRYCYTDEPAQKYFL